MTVETVETHDNGFFRDIPPPILGEVALFFRLYM